MANLTEEQRQAILKQSEGMTTSEKKAFADKIRGAQDKQKAKDAVVKQPTAPVVKQQEPVDINKRENSKTTPSPITHTPSSPGTQNTIKDTVGIPGISPKTEQPVLKDIGAREGVSGQIKEAFSALANNGKSKTEAIEGIKSRFESKGFDVSKFETQFADSIAEFDSLDLSSDEFFSGLMSGESFNKAIQATSADYAVGKQQFDSFNALNKTEDGIYRAIKGNTLDRTILSELNKDPQYAEWINKANEKIAQEAINEQLLTKSAGEILKLDQAEKTAYVKAVFGEFGLDRDFQKELDDNTKISTAKLDYETANKAYLENKQKQSTLLNKIKAENPNASPALLNALYNRQAQPLIDAQNQAITDMGVAKGTYDIEFGELEYVNNLSIAQSDKQMQAYNQLFTAELENFVDEREYTQALETIKANKKTAQNYAFTNVESGVVLRVNKETGEYEFIRTDNVPEGETVETSNGSTINSSGTDFSTSTYLQDKYPNEASVKNNNPAGLTSGVSRTLQGLWEDAGIEWEIGSKRPESEGGNYIAFTSVQDGLKAYQIALTERGDDVFKRLEKWVGTNNADTNYAYANDILTAAGIPTYAQFGLKWSEMDGATKDKIMTEQMKKESPGFLKELKELGISKANGTFDFDAGKTSEGITNTEDLINLGQYLIDTQKRGAGFSEKDVEQFSEAVNRYAKQGDSQTVFQLFRNKILQDTEVGPQIFDTGEFTRGLSNLKSTLEEFKKTGDTGLIRNIAEKTANYFGRTTDDEIAKANNQLGVLVADYIRAISGTAASDAEVDRLLKNFPTIKNVEDFNTVILDTLGFSVTEKARARLETSLGFKKELASDIFPELYESIQEGEGAYTEDDLKSEWESGFSTEEEEIYGSTEY